MCWHQCLPTMHCILLVRIYMVINLISLRGTYSVTAFECLQYVIHAKLWITVLLQHSRKSSKLWMCCEFTVEILCLCHSYSLCEYSRNVMTVCSQWKSSKHYFLLVILISVNIVEIKQTLWLCYEFTVQTLLLKKINSDFSKNYSFKFATWWFRYKFRHFLTRSFLWGRKATKNYKRLYKINGKLLMQKCNNYVFLPSHSELFSGTTTHALTRTASLCNHRQPLCSPPLTKTKTSEVHHLGPVRENYIPTMNFKGGDSKEQTYHWRPHALR